LAEGIDVFVLRWLEETPVWQLVLWEENLLDECLGIELRKVVIAVAKGYNDNPGEGGGRTTSYIYIPL